MNVLGMEYEGGVRADYVALWGRILRICASSGSCR